MLYCFEINVLCVVVVFLAFVSCFLLLRGYCCCCCIYVFVLLLVVVVVCVSDVSGIFRHFCLCGVLLACCCFLVVAKKNPTKKHKKHKKHTTNKKTPNTHIHTLALSLSLFPNEGHMIIVT